MTIDGEYLLLASELRAGGLRLYEQADPMLEEAGRWLLPLPAKVQSDVLPSIGTALGIGK